MNKPTILMIPSWYPTKTNPYNGCFFREQALALQKNFDFIVLTYKRKKTLAIIYAIKKLFGLNKPKIVFVQDDKGLKEYKYLDSAPQFIVWDLFSDRFCQIVKHRVLKNGVGRIEPKSSVKARISNISYLKKKNLLPKFDCVYSLTSQDMAALGHDFANIYNVPHVTAEHAPFPWPGHVLTDTAAYAIEKADMFLAISQDKIRQVMLQNIHIDPYYVGNLVDETKFTLSTEQHEIKSFLIVAANSFYKNYDLFIKSMEELKRIATKDFKIIICGYNSNKGYSQNAKELEDRVHNSIIASNTQMIEAASREEIPHVYNSADVFVMTSIQEGFPVSAVEAACSGLPIISTRCGGVEDYIDDSIGRIFAITDYKGIAKACNDYLNGVITFNPQHIRDSVVAKFGNKGFTDNVSKAFYEAIENYSK